MEPEVLLGSIFNIVPMTRCRNTGAFAKCGSYYPKVTCADELWDHHYVEACQELDREFPAALLLPVTGWSLELSRKMTEECIAREKCREVACSDDLPTAARDWLERYFSVLNKKKVPHV